MSTNKRDGGTQHFKSLNPGILLADINDDELLELHRQMSAVAWLPTETTRYVAFRSMSAKIDRAIKARGLTP
jgi:hypothetical protein